MNDRITDILFIVILLLLTSIFISWSFVVEPQWNVMGNESASRGSFIDGAIARLGSFFSAETPAPGDMSTDLTGQLRTGVTLTVDARDVARRADQAAAPGVSPEERSRTIALLRGAMSAFSQSISSAEWRLARARDDKSRTEAEIREAEDALGRMHSGADFISRRINRSTDGGGQ